MTYATSPCRLVRLLPLIVVTMHCVKGFVLLSPVTPQRPLQQPLSFRPTVSLFASNNKRKQSQSKKNDDKQQLPLIPLIPNEFSRTIQPDRVLRGTRHRDYEMALTATMEECDLLAKRFDLRQIASLSASLQLRQEGGRSTESVEVEGTVLATVTQTCVRTNEDFTMDLEFPIYAIVRPISRNENLSEGMSISRKSEYRSNMNDNIDSMDAMQLQRLLEQDSSSRKNKDSTSDDGTLIMGGNEDVLMEDAAIYALETGTLDVGELVSQLFWLQLDPYPKKPGTTPIQRSITG